MPNFLVSDIIPGVVNFSFIFSGHSCCNVSLGFCLVVVILLSKLSQIAIGKVGKKQACGRLRAVVGRLLLFQVLTRFVRSCLFYSPCTEMAVNGVWRKENRFQNFLDIMMQKLRA